MKQRLALLAVAALAFGGTAAFAIEPCETPMAFPGNDAYTRDGVNFFALNGQATIAWDHSTASGGFNIQVALSPETDDTGAFADVERSKSTGSAARSWTFSGLEERTYYYHVQAKTRTGVCTRSAWSNIVAITQDDTGPVVEITTEAEPVAGVVPTGYATFLLEDNVVIHGTADDLPGEEDTPSSGARVVVVTLQNTTPVVGGGDEPVVKEVYVDTDGTWLASFPGLSLGTYQLSAVGVDLVSNQSEDADTLNVLVVSA